MDFLQLSVEATKQSTGKGLSYYLEHFVFSISVTRMVSLCYSCYEPVCLLIGKLHFADIFNFHKMYTFVL